MATANPSAVSTPSVQPSLPGPEPVTPHVPCTIPEAFVRVTQLKNGRCVRCNKYGFGIQSPEEGSFPDQDANHVCVVAGDPDGVGVQVDDLNCVNLCKELRSTVWRSVRMTGERCPAFKEQMLTSADGESSENCPLYGFLDHKLLVHLQSKKVWNNIFQDKHSEVYKSSKIW